MSKTRRPPEILRKSHPHLDVDERARSRRELLDALEEAVEDDDSAMETDTGTVAETDPIESETIDTEEVDASHEKDGT